MGFLDRFFGDDNKLTRPDFSRFNHIELDFSGTKLRFKDASHTAMYPINDWPEDLDIYNIDKFEAQKDGSYAKRFYVRGWDFSGKKNIVKGGCNIDSFLFYFTGNQDREFNSFNKELFESQVLIYCNKTWGRQNPGSSLGSLGSEVNYLYPVSSTELNYLEINKVKWCHFTSQPKGRPPELLYICPISKNHILVNRFAFSAYREIDFYSPETNLEQTCYDVVNDYMSEFYIELSPRAKAEKAEATDPV